MNKTKKLASLLLALVMAFALAMPAFAIPNDDGVQGDTNIAALSDEQTGDTTTGDTTTGDTTTGTTTTTPPDATQGGKTEGPNHQLDPSNTAAKLTIGRNEAKCSLIIDNAESNHKYMAYQIFSGDLYTTEDNGKIKDKILSNIQWGTGVDSTALLGDTALKTMIEREGAGSLDTNKMGEITAAQLADWLNGKSSAIAAEFSKIVADHTAAWSVALEYDAAAKNYQSASKMTPGYYLIKDTSIDADKMDDDVYSANMMQVLGDETMKPKAKKPTLEKKILEDTEEKDHTSKDVGDTVNFQVTATVPNMQGYDSYKYTMSDTMSDGLTFTADSVVVKIGETTYTKDTDYTVATTDNGFTLDFTRIYDIVGGDPNGPNKNLAPGTEIIITYSAVLNEKAKEDNVETNTAKLTYSNNPNDADEHTDTPDDTVYVYDFEIIVDKYDSSDTTKATKLPDAEFVLTKAGENGKLLYYTWNSDAKKVEWKEAVTSTTEGNVTTNTPPAGAVFTTNAQGALPDEAFKGLKAGTYTLTELKAPAGFNLLPNSIEIVITDKTETVAGTEGTTTKVVGYNITVMDKKAGGDVQLSTKDYLFDTTNPPAPGNAEGTSMAAQLTQTVEVPNSSGATLPETGGIGTTIFYVVGGVLAAGAVILLITKRRMNIDK